MYASDIKNRQHQSMNNGESASADCRGRPHTSPIVMVVGDVAGRLAGSVVKDTITAKCQT